MKLNSFPGDNPNYNMVLEPTGKRAYFLDGGAAWRISPLVPKEVAEVWRKEYELCSCKTCTDSECICRNMASRFPKDIGGQNQCLRLMKSKTKYTWRNGNGDVITIPEEIMRAINEQSSETSESD